MRIDPGSHVPIYLQIADEIRAAVAAGVYRPGEVLPSLRAMAIDVHVNPNTVQRAYDELEREGLSMRNAARGCLSPNRAPPLPSRAPATASAAPLTRPFGPASAAGMSAEANLRDFSCGPGQFDQTWEQTPMSTASTERSGHRDWSV